jgi:uncharacterized glyoxalase superfamily protein PhnB
MQQRLSIITLGVKDVKIATEFYENKFGWHKLQSSNEHITFLQLNGILVALFETNELAKDASIENNGSGFKGFTLAYNTRSEHEVDVIISDLAKKGVKIVKQPGKVFWGGYSSYIADVDGHLWEIAYNPYLEIDEIGNIK